MTRTVEQIAEGLVERVARAICKADGYDPEAINSWDETIQWRAYVDSARAAIEAVQSHADPLPMPGAG